MNAVETKLIAEIERLRAELAKARGHGEAMPCGHNSRWLVYGNPVDVNSERHCLFCELDQLRAERDQLYRAVWELPEHEEIEATLHETICEIHECNRLAAWVEVVE